MYQNMGEILKDRKVGEWELQHFQIKPGNLYAFKNGIAPGNYVRLCHNGHIVMSNTYMERWTNMNFCTHAHGDVLIGGLCIGPIILATPEKTQGHKITLIRKKTEGIDKGATPPPLKEKNQNIPADVFLLQQTTPRAVQ